VTRLTHPSPRDDPEAFARAFLAAVNERLPKWFDRGDVLVKETHLEEAHGDWAVVVLFRVTRSPDVTYGFRWENVCREATNDLSAAEAAGSDTADVLGPTVTVMLANLDELIHATGAALPKSNGDDIVWI